MKAQAALLQPAPPETPKWSLASRIVFRFACLYFVLYGFPGLPVISDVLDLWMAPVETWAAVHVFHLSGTVITRQPTGSGDTTLDYISNLIVLFIATLGTVVWSVADRKRQAYPVVHASIRLLVRYSLALTLMGYGFAKVFPNQMPAPSFSRLLQPYGEFSPMGVLWSFLGASPAYEFFSGAAEVLAGALLLFRRTTTLGAGVSIAVLANVVMLNFTYDVPVKLFSSNLLLMAVFLLAPDARNLFGLFVLHRPATAVTIASPWTNLPRPAKVGMGIAKGLFLVFMLSGMVLGNYNQYRQAGDTSQRPALYGLYDVESFTLNGQERPPLVTDSQRWRRVAIENPRSLMVSMMDGSARYYSATYDSAGTKAELHRTEEPNQKYTLNCSRPDPQHLLMTGMLFGDSVTIRLRKVELPKFSLTNRGFHWIQEFPFNR